MEASSELATSHSIKGVAQPSPRFIGSLSEAQHFWTATCKRGAIAASNCRYQRASERMAPQERVWRARTRRVRRRRARESKQSNMISSSFPSNFDPQPFVDPFLG